MLSSSACIARPTTGLGRATRAPAAARVGTHALLIAHHRPGVLLLAVRRPPPQRLAAGFFSGRRAGDDTGRVARARAASTSGPVEPPPRPAPKPAPPAGTTPPTPALFSSSSSAATDPRFTLVRIPGDGSCLFRALAQGHHALSHGGSLLDRAGLLAAGFEVRRAVCASLTRSRADIEPFLDCPFPAYIESMALEGTWGGEPELAAAPSALRRPVCVYEAAGQRGPFGGVASLRKVSEYGADAWPTTPPVCLLFSGAHYDLLLQEGDGRGAG